jgi:hypothetical protein
MADIAAIISFGEHGLQLLFIALSAVALKVLKKWHFSFLTE